MKATASLIVPKSVPAGVVGLVGSCRRSLKFPTLDHRVELSEHTVLRGWAVRDVR